MGMKRWPLLMILLVAATLAGCGNKLKMPEVKMPRVLEDEKAEVKVQKEIELALNTDDPESYFRQMFRLFDRMKEVGWDESRLVTEVINYASHIQGQDQAAKYARLLNTLNVPRPAVVQAAAGRLNSGEPAQVQASRILLRWAAPPDPLSRADFSYFRAYLESHPAPPHELVLWMYDRDPAAAMMEMRAVYGSRSAEGDSKEVLLGEHVISEILWRKQSKLLGMDELDDQLKGQLERLSEVRAWWVRLYVAEILLKYPRLRTPAVVERLMKDQDPMVKSVIGRVAAG